MTAMPPLRDILNNTPADAVNVDFNFNTLEAHIGSELINRDGSVAMTGPLTLSGPPTAPAHAVSKQYVDTSAIPVATIWQYAGQLAPLGWVFCDGASKSTTDPAYVALFAAIGYIYGGSGGNFNLPNLGGRVPVGRAATDPLFGTLGQTGGSRDLIVPVHNHGGSVNLNTDTRDVNHTHRYDHGHGASGSADQQGNHRHIATPNVTHIYARVDTGAGYGLSAAGVGSFIHGILADPYTDYQGSHAHNIGVTVNGTGAVSTGYSDQPGVSHLHNVNGAVTVDNAGVSGANGTVQPYVTVNYIIRIG